MTNFFSELKTNLKKVEDDQLTPEQVRLLDADPKMSRQGELIGKDKGHHVAQSTLNFFIRK
jgi:hypothetical protein